LICQLPESAAGMSSSLGVDNPIRIDEFATEDLLSFRPLLSAFAENPGEIGNANVGPYTSIQPTIDDDQAAEAQDPAIIELWCYYERFIHVNRL